MAPSMATTSKKQLSEQDRQPFELALLQPCRSTESVFSQALGGGSTAPWVRLASLEGGFHIAESARSSDTGNDAVRDDDVKAEATSGRVVAEQGNAPASPTNDISRSCDELLHAYVSHLASFTLL